MSFTNTPPKWDAQGAEPSADLQANGFSAGYKPPAQYFNYLFNKYTACIKELQELASAQGVTLEETGTSLTTHTSAKGNPHGVTKSQVGLGNVDNTSDANKPISTAAQTALDKKANTADLSKVAISGSYNDLSGKPTIPSAVTVDTAMSSTSTNPVQNKVVNEALGTKANSADLTSHTGSKSNPHGVTKSQVGLGNVPNVATNDQTPTFTAATTRANIASGEKLSVILGKIAKFFTDLKTVAFSGSYDDLSNKPTIPAAVAVKGNAETAYRTGNVNITPANIGLGSVNNTADANKSVKYATSAGSATSATKATQDASGNTITSTYALKSKYGDTTINVGRKENTTVGDNSTAEGYNTTASGHYSHAEGHTSKASGTYAHAEGYNTTASGNFSHAEGCNSIAGNLYAHAEGSNTEARNQNAHAEGYNTIATGSCSHVEGYYSKVTAVNSHAEGYYTVTSGKYGHAEGNNTEALQNQHAQGHYNNTNTATQNSTSGTSTGTAFVIGNGSSDGTSNAFRVRGDGLVYATNATVNTGADYAEYFEWADGNKSEQDRVGLFVTFDENTPEKIKIANDGDYILGIVSGMPSVIGNGDEDWKKRYILDDFGRYITETFEYEDTELSEETGKEITVTKTGTKWKENPAYDKTKPYVPRDERTEWDAIGMVGVLSVYDDGTCQVNGYCKCTNNGIATAAEKGAETYRVIKRVTDNIVKVVIK